MIPLKLTIQGIGPFAAATVDWESLDSPVAICAPYGAGKSFLCEAIFFALYARGGWYSGSVYDILTQGGTGEGRIKLEFYADGDRWRAVREIRAPSTHRATLWHLNVNDVSEATMKAGPKVSDFDAFIQTLCGSADTALATYFLSQNRRNDLCGQPGEANLVARRRAAFNELLGVNDLDAEAERMRSERGKVGAQIEVLEAQLQEAPAAELVGARFEELSSTKERLTFAQTDLGCNEHEAEEVRSYVEAVAKDEASVALELSTAKAQAREAKAAVQAAKRLQERMLEVQTRAAKLPEVEREHAQLAQARDERDGLLPALKAREAWEAAMLSYERAVAKREALGREMSALCSSLPSAETEAMAGLVGALEEEYARVADENNKASRQNDQIEAERISLRVHVGSVEAEQEAVRRRIDAKPLTPFGDACAPCPLMKQWHDLPAELQRTVGELAELRARLAVLPELAALQDASDLVRRQAEAKEALRSVQRGGGARAQIESLETQLASPSPDHPGEEPPDLRQDLDQVQQRVEVLSGAVAKLDACWQAQRDLENLQTEYEAIRQQAEEAAQILADADAKIAVYSAREGEIAQERETFGNALRLATEAIRHLRQKVQELQNEVGRAEAALEAAQAKAKEQAQKRQKVKELTERQGALDDLCQCFGPRGVRQILIDSAAPELEAIADELFEQATQGRMRLRIATQRILRDGNTAEDFGILIKDARGERDATEHSGGELQLCSILFRISVALWIGRLQGHKPDFLCLDEAFDRLGAQGAEDLLRVLFSLSDRIQKIVVVTHDEHIANRLRSVVRVEKGVGGARVL